MQPVDLVDGQRPFGHLLVGGQPDDPTGILSVRQYPGGLAVAGLPPPWEIRWQQRYVASELARIDAVDDWSFAILHELSHLFDLDGRWVWDAEFWASFKMVYILETLDGRVMPAGTLYVGADVAELYRPYFEAAMASGDWNWAAILYRFILVERSIGWEPFQQTHRAFLALPEGEVPVTGAAKLTLFLDELSAAAGQDVRALFTPAELAWMFSHI